MRKEKVENYKLGSDLEGIWKLGNGKGVHILKKKIEWWLKQGRLEKSKKERNQTRGRIWVVCCELVSAAMLVDEIMGVVRLQTYDTKNVNATM